MKKTISLFLALIVILSLCACKSTEKENDDKLSVIAVLFAEYDLASHVSGGTADVTMLLPPGSESHSYDPTPQDIISIKNCDVFICGGGESDSWIDSVLSSVDSDNCAVIKMTEVCELKEEETVEGMQEEKGEESDEEEYDEHVWTSPKNAVLILNEIERVFCEKDEKNADAYRKNAQKYRYEIEELDRESQAVRKNAERDEIIFADRFPMRYFTDEYSLRYYAAFPGCSSEAEPSAKTVKFLIDKVREDRIPVVFTIEFSNKAIAYAIKDETGAEILEFHSCHNVTKEQFASGVSYISLMRQNLENLKEALN